MRVAGMDLAAETHEVAVVDADGQVLVKPTALTEDAAGYETSFEQLGASAELPEHRLRLAPKFSAQDRFARLPSMRVKQ